jgi:hypothetical protein
MFPLYARALKSFFLQILPRVLKSEHESWIKNSLSLPEHRRQRNTEASNSGAHPVLHGLKLTPWQKVAEEGRAT